MTSRDSSRAANGRPFLRSHDLLRQKSRVGVLETQENFVSGIFSCHSDENYTARTAFRLVRRWVVEPLHPSAISADRLIRRQTVQSDQRPASGKIRAEIYPTSPTSCGCDDDKWRNRADQVAAGRPDGVGPAVCPLAADRRPWRCRLLRCRVKRRQKEENVSLTSLDGDNTRSLKQTLS